MRDQEEEFASSLIAINACQRVWCWLACQSSIPAPEIFFEAATGGGEKQLRRLWTGDKQAGDPRRSERGAVLAEFALMAPVLVMILFGIIQFGITISRAQAVEAAAREGGRLASLSSTTQTDVVSRVNAALAGALGDSTPTVSVEPGICAGREGQSVTVTVTAPHRITIPLVLDRQTTLTGHALFRCEA